MDNVRIAILSSKNAVIGFMDNNAPDALHYYDEELHVYLESLSSTFDFTVSTHENSWFKKITIGNKVSFRYKGRDYYFNITSTEQTDDEITASCVSGCFELTNESLEEFYTKNGESSYSFMEYMKKFDPADVLTAGRESVNRSVNYRMEILSGQCPEETQLSRLYSLADVFGYEVEITPTLNDDYTLKEFTVNIFTARKLDEGGNITYNGIGTDRRNGRRLRYGKGVSGVKKTSDIGSIITAVRPYFTLDGTTYDLTGILPAASWINSYYTGQMMKCEVVGDQWRALDSDGNVLYYKDKASAYIYAKSAIKRFPSHTNGSGSKAIEVSYECDSELTSYNKVFCEGLSYLVTNSEPETTYEVDITSDMAEYGFVGDTICIIDEEFEPPIYLDARITEQQICFTDPSQNKATFSNVKMVGQRSTLTDAVRNAVTTANSASAAASSAKETAEAVKTNLAADYTSTANLDSVISAFDDIFSAKTSSVTDADNAPMGMCTVSGKTCSNLPDTTNQYWLFTFFNANGNGIQFAKQTTQAFVLYMRTKNNSGTSAWKSITFA